MNDVEEPVTEFSHRPSSGDPEHSSKEYWFKNIALRNNRLNSVRQRNIRLEYYGLMGIITNLKTVNQKVHRAMSSCLNIIL